MQQITSMQNKVRNNRKGFRFKPQQLILKEKIKLCFSKQRCLKYFDKANSIKENVR